MLNFVILIRKTEDWGNVNSPFDLTPPFGNKYISKDKFAKFIVKWNANMSINYFQYRQKMKDIAIKNMQATGIPIATNSIEFLKNNKDNKDLFVLPTDDDDWFHPDIQEHLLSAIKKDDNYISWVTPRMSDKGFTPQNPDATFPYGYAYRCSEVKLKHLMIHTTVSNDNCIDKKLSLYVRNSASIHPVAIGNNVLPEIKSIPTTAPDDLKWVQPYLDQLNAIELFVKS